MAPVPDVKLKACTTVPADRHDRDVRRIERNDREPALGEPRRQVVECS
jgi:hypothetical protein